MGISREDMSGRQHHESLVLRVSSLPLVRSALQSVNSVYSEVKGRYPLLNLVGGVAEVGVRSVSNVAMTTATPLLQSLELQIEVAESFALFGLDSLEKNFPILNQSTDEVVGHLKDAFFLTLDDVQLWVGDGLDVALDQMERLSEGAVAVVRQLQDSQVGQVASFGLDDLLTRLEDAAAHYLPLPPTLRREWELRVQELEDEEEDDGEPSLWTRVRSLLLNLGLQLYHRMMKVRDMLQRAALTLGGAANQVGLGLVLDLSGELLLVLQRLLVALVYRTENVRERMISEVKGRTAMLAELRPVRQISELPVQIQQLLGDLQELAKILLQLVINATPLYTMLQQPSAQEVEDFLNQEDFSGDVPSGPNSADSLFLKAMDGRPRRRQSLYSRSGRSPLSPQSADPPSVRRRSSLRDLPPPGVRRRSSLMDLPPPELDVQPPPIPSDGGKLRRPSATELLLAPLKQFVAQSQKAFEYLSPNAPEDPEPGDSTDNGMDC
ncbi:perilipin 6 [Gymnodraco acuticeps]|uniref:Perilipin 6 n=1 Tax=Gymnodraco acuticeps TaxID=8218 RepID=A0A6P8VLE5_GYMAC|nr:perilipin 6 [Gymnodraco acuticeps]